MSYWRKKLSFKVLREAGWQVHVRLMSVLSGLVLLLLIAIELTGLEGVVSADRNISADRIADASLSQSDEMIASWLAVVGKRSLFKPAIPLPGRRVANQTVEKILSVVSVHGIMELDGHQVAYLKIKGVGMRPFQVGDHVEEMFAVTRIDDRTVELEVAGERIELDL